MYLQHKYIICKNVDFAISGTILLVYDPLNLELENIKIDQYKSIGGFDMQMECNYPEANLDAHFYVKNVNIHNSQDRIVFPSVFAALENQLPGDMVVENYISTTYIRFDEQSGMLNFIVQPRCVVDSDKDRYYNITNATVPLETPFTANFLYFRIIDDIYRKTYGFFDDINCSNHRYNIFG